jgi:hypothetical protein
MVFQIKDFTVIKKDLATYLPAWKRFVCWLFKITPEKRYHYEIEIDCFDSYMIMGGIFVTPTHIKFYVTSKPNGLFRAVTIEPTKEFNFVAGQNVLIGTAYQENSVNPSGERIKMIRH